MWPKVSCVPLYRPGEPSAWSILLVSVSSARVTDMCHHAHLQKDTFENSSRLASINLIPEPDKDNKIKMIFMMNMSFQ